MAASSLRAWLIFSVALFSVSFLCLPLQAMSATPPTGENAYCGKGNVAQFGAKDGVAELPKACYYTGLDGAPSPGKQIHVEPKSDLASAVDHAKCGDTLLLPAGSSFDVSSFPSKKCDDQHYVTIRTDAPYTKLPAEGTRISPAWSGIASLPGRPAFAQPAGGPAKLLAVIVTKRPAGVPVGDHVRFVGIEWTTAPGADISRMVSVEHGNHIIFDRDWIHPAEGAEVAHGISFIDGAQMVAVVNSYISGLNCIARTGKCTDATAVGGGKGDEPIATIKIYNNFLESSGENILFGGNAATQVPTDLEIRRNHLFRPMLWKEGEPGYTAAASGQPFIVKNNFELKSAIRVLFEANLLENTWGGFSQTGYSILLTPKSQQNQCPVCRVNDVTIRFNRIRNVAGVFQIANAAAKTGGFSADGGRYSIHDVFADDVHDKDYKGPGNFLVLISWEPPLHDIQIDHVTAFATGKLLAILNTGAKLKNFSITNSIFSVGADRPISSAGGGPESCAGKSQAVGGQAVLESCFDPYKFENNLIISGRGSFPKGNFVVSSAGDAAIRDLKDTIAKDPRPCHEKGPGCGKISRGARSASDGRDLGADIDAVEAAITGVE
jgi:hypothetical protein